MDLGLSAAVASLASLAAVLETQYPNGNVPGWRSRTSGSADRSQPPIGAFVTLKIFERIGLNQFGIEERPKEGAGAKGFDPVASAGTFIGEVIRSLRGAIPP